MAGGWLGTDAFGAGGGRWSLATDSEFCAKLISRVGRVACTADAWTKAGCDGSREERRAVTSDSDIDGCSSSRAAAGNLDWIHSFLPALLRTPSRLLAVMDKWGWQQVGPGIFETPEGRLDLLWDGDAALQGVMRRGWARALWNIEPRAVVHPEAVQASWEPCTVDHVKRLRNAPNLWSPPQQLALATGIDVARLQRVGRREFPCPCGDPMLTRAHLACECPFRPEPRFALRPPTCEAERR